MLSTPPVFSVVYTVAMGRVLFAARPPHIVRPTPSSTAYGQFTSVKPSHARLVLSCHASRLDELTAARLHVDRLSTGSQELSVHILNERSYRPPTGPTPVCCSALANHTARNGIGVRADCGQVGVNLFLFKPPLFPLLLIMHNRTLPSVQGVDI